MFNGSDVAEIRWARNYYKERLLPNSGNIVDISAYSKNARMMSLKSAKVMNRKIPIWEKAIQGKTNLYDFVEIPIKYDQKVTPLLYSDKRLGNPERPDNLILKASLTKLIIYKNKKGQINQRLVSFIPTREYLLKTGGDISHNKINRLDKNFEGYLIYREWDGTYLFSLMIKNGKAVGRMALKANNGYSFKEARYLKREQSCVTMEVYEWFQDCFYQGDDPNPVYCNEPYSEYVGTFDVCWNDGYGNDPCADPANFNFGLCGGDDRQYEFQPETKDLLVKEFCDGLTPQQKHTINSMLAELKNYDCASKYIYNKFSAANISFNFCIGSGFGNAAYNPGDKSFNFTTDYSASRTDIMEHELFHAYQDDQYSGGTQQYGRLNGVPQAGFVNIEFEQALITDLLHGSTTAFDSYDPNGQQVAEYLEWISNLTAGGTAYPKLNPQGNATEQAKYSEFMNKYNSFLTAFNNISGNPYSSTQLNLVPIAFINLFNNINPNCQ